MTLDIDSSVLAELKKRQQIDNKTLGSLVSELLADAMAQRRLSSPPATSWNARSMGTKVDPLDKEAIREAELDFIEGRFFTGEQLREKYLRD